jgi:hypothetical protein
MSVGEIATATAESAGETRTGAFGTRGVSGPFPLSQARNAHSIATDPMACFTTDTFAAPDKKLRPMLSPLHQKACGNSAGYLDNIDTCGERTGALRTHRRPPGVENDGAGLGRDRCKRRRRYLMRRKPAVVRSGPSMRPGYRRDPQVGIIHDHAPRIADNDTGARGALGPAADPCPLIGRILTLAHEIFKLVRPRKLPLRICPDTRERIDEMIPVCIANGSGY